MLFQPFQFGQREMVAERIAVDLVQLLRPDQPAQFVQIFFPANIEIQRPGQGI